SKYKVRRCYAIQFVSSETPLRTTDVFSDPLLLRPASRRSPLRIGARLPERETLALESAGNRVRRGLRSRRATGRQDQGRKSNFGNRHRPRRPGDSRAAYERCARNPAPAAAGSEATSAGKLRAGRLRSPVHLFSAV